MCRIFRKKSKPTPPDIRPAPVDEGAVEADTVTVEPSSTPEPEPEIAGYTSSEAHLTDELRRVEQLLRAYLFRVKSARLHSRPDAADGFPDRAQSVLRSGYRWEDPSSDRECTEAERRAIAAARRWERVIVARLLLTPKYRPGTVRSDLRAWELVRIFGLIPDVETAVPAPDPNANAPEGDRETRLLDIVLLALLAERAPRYRSALKAVSTEGAISAETLTEIAWVADHPDSRHWAPFAANSPLIANGLIRLGVDEGPTRTVRIDPRIADYLLRVEGDESGLGESVRVVAEPYAAADLGVDEPIRRRIHDLAEWWQPWWSKSPERRFVALFHGPAGSPMLEGARALWIGGTKPGRRLLAVDAAKAPAGPDWVPFVRGVYREARLRSRAVFWQGAEPLLADAGGIRWEALIAEAERFELPTILATETAWDPARSFHAVHRIFVRIEFPVPGAETRRTLWRRRLAAEGSVLARDDTPVRKNALDLITSFQFTEGQIDDATATARGLFRPPAPRPPDPTGERDAEVYYEACRRQSGRRLVSFAQRIQPRPGDRVADSEAERELLARVVLSVAAERHLLELFRRMRHLTTVYHTLGFEHRLSLGRGLIALFTGPSGTGKTYAAATLAGLLQKDLYKVDMAAVVSKYVGETEKNLSRVFSDAQDANAVLFFDEADALFGKRGDVEQAQDRWANLEVNYLLQRVEEYTGTVILATNFRQNIDEAFLRRIQMMIDFDRPSAEARCKILQGLFRGTEVPVPDVETVLAPIATRFEDLTGGNLKNVVLDAAFRAVAANPDGKGVTVGLKELVLGTAREYQKLGKPIDARSFGKEWTKWIADELKIPVG